MEVFDEALNGGNEDDQISTADKIFRHLKIWRDINHDGISQRQELKPLTSVFIEAISLDYKDADAHLDRFGNDFRFSADVTFVGGKTTRGWAVFFGI